ncbi:MAG: hypothetical protein P9L92_08445 [Candidatus Electryonea clarkiae]|nr:hypothetical protein [Candidatus Electryonea clarkiae]MDP8285742.1 hypothetical protein [Candidatus Electryonea clarkiae]
MKLIRPILIWLLAFVLTLASAVYQRLTGPTHPARGTIEIAGEKISYKLLRNYNTGEDCPVSVKISNEQINASIIWKRYKMDEDVSGIKMHREGEALVAALPMQPPAGKLEYEVLLQAGDEKVTIPVEGPAIIRYKGAVPAFVLIPHVLFMFAAMFVSMRVLLAAIGGGKVKKISWIAFSLLVLGGLFLGPVVQKYAFGAFWTGWPFGEDLTDNKTLLAVVGWIVALWFMRGSNGDRRGRWWAFAASLILFSIYMIPHSMRGSELDYSKLPGESTIETVDTVAVMDSSIMTEDTLNIPIPENSQ